MKKQTIKEKKVKEKKPVEKKKVQKQKVMPVKKIKRSKRQKALDEKKAKLAVRARQTKWAPVWIVIKKYGTGKRIHPSATTKYRRSWRRTKLHIKPRKQRKSHFG